MKVEATELLPAPLRLRLGEASEHALLRRAQRGSSEAFEELFRRSWRPAYRAAYLVVGDAAAAEDIAQEAILAAIRNLDRFDRSRPFAPWLHRIAVNRAIDWARAARLRPAVGLDERARDHPATEPEAQISDELLASVHELSEEHRAVVALRYLLGYTPGEIAELLDLPRGTVNSRLRRALDVLRPSLEEGGAR
jgi:RNA polymerase sigma-70 factor (ECF subfamily)